MPLPYTAVEVIRLCIYIPLLQSNGGLYSAKRSNENVPSGLVVYHSGRGGSESAKRVKENVYKDRQVHKARFLSHVLRSLNLHLLAARVYTAAVNKLILL